MRNGIPAVYVVFRTVWSLLHLALLTLAATLVARWWFHDSQGADLVAGWWAWSSNIQAEIYYAIPFPWS